MLSVFPKLWQPLKEGKTHVSHIAQVSAHLTQANESKILAALSNKISRKNLKFFLSAIEADGNVREVVPTVEVKFQCTKVLLEKLERAQSLLSINCPGAGGVPIPAASRHAVVAKSEGRCSYVSSDGRQCGETRFLQIDHRKMVCRGGGNELENLRILCANHNRYVAEVDLGHEFVAGKIAASRQTHPM